MRECLACGGKYEPVQGNMRYFHVCPPLVDPDTGEETKRPGHRDENLDGKHTFVDNKLTSDVKIKAEGKGYKEI